MGTKNPGTQARGVSAGFGWCWEDSERFLPCTTGREAHSTHGGPDGPAEEVEAGDGAVRHLSTSRSWAPNAPHRPGGVRTGFHPTGPGPESQAYLQLVTVQRWVDGFPRGHCRR